MKNRDFFVCMLPMWIAAAMMPLSMTGIEITVAVALFGLLVNQYFNRRQERIRRVVNEWMECFNSTNYTNGVDALLRAGVCELNNRFELSEACRKICRREKRAQRPSLEPELPDVKLFSFLKFCHKNNHDISSGSDTLVVILQFKGEI